MDIFGVFALVGGLALFLFGMDAMGKGLEKLSGGRLEKLLEKLTSNRLKAVALGTLVTGIIQSSSATTVMVVGFVNSGIMKLTQAVGIIMGANIGTTITSWILSLSSIEGDSFLLKLLKPSSFAPILALIGIIFIMFNKKGKKKDIGMILIGFAILMTGMDQMSAAVKPLRDVPEFTNILLMFSNPIFGMLAGLVLTAIIQSSSASVGILQALCATGAVPFSTAIPIIMGQNIGTCVTAIISSIGASKNAKRTAAVHLYFNVIGTVVFMVVFYAIHAVIPFGFMELAADAKGIATVHSLFNVGATLLLLPFAKGLEKLAVITIKDSKEDKEKENIFKALDVRFLDTPSIALEQCKKLTDDMARITKESLFGAIELLDNYSEKREKELVDMETLVDRYEDEVGAYLMKVNSRDLSNKDSHTVNTLLHSIGNWERISDHALNICDAAREIHEKKISFSKAATEELAVYTRAIKDILNMTVEAFEYDDISMAKKVEPLEEVIDDINLMIKNRHVQRLRAGECTIELGFVLNDILTNYERVSDHCSNVAVTIIQTEDYDVEAHRYIGRLKDEDEFKRAFELVQREYRLPELAATK
ncbi:MAG: Na/Pi cotransporter family protein [Lachnospiraceae bacterium]|nr:Na/Pi cotransporter family protein [Lachnospiraceae bacterium]